jgi:sugar lactone lactonase YvrE
MKPYLIIILIAALACGCNTLRVPGVVQATAGVFGPEDIVHDKEAGRLLVSCSDRRGGYIRQGTIMSYDLVDESLKNMDVQLPDGAAFNPHGICLQTVEGEQRLYVISHRKDFEKRHDIWQFRVDGHSLVDAKNIAANGKKNVTWPNDIAVSGGGTVFVTNSARNAAPSRVLTGLGLANSGSLAMYDNGVWQLVDEGLSFPNGVWADARNVYVTTSTGRELFRYDRVIGGVENRRQLAWLRALENINSADDGSLLIAARQEKIWYALHTRHHYFRSPSVLYKAKVTNGGDISPMNVPGINKVDGVSAAIQVGDHVYLGSVFEPRLVKLAVVE